MALSHMSWETSYSRVVSLMGNSDNCDRGDVDHVMAVRTPLNNKQGAKRMGAKTVKSMDNISHAHVLQAEGATNF